MRSHAKRWRAVLWFGLVAGACAAAPVGDGDGPTAATQPTRAAQAAVKPAAVDLSRPTLYVVPYAHLDTQWRWEYPQVIREYLPKTLRDNFALFEKYPHYVFNFSGANRYRMMKEYYPADYERLKQYVAAGRWFPSGSSMEENDVNNPSAESIIRQILYGKEYFRRDFGRTSAEFMLPDCFGFPASLPSILAHTGIRGFSTQKLSWRSGARVGGPESPQKTPEGIPFNVGVWEGPDGQSVIAALNATDYTGVISEDISKPLPPGTPVNNNLPDWPERVQWTGKPSGVFADYRYYGTGDTGGAPRESSVRLMEAIVTGQQTALGPPQRPGQPRPPMTTPQTPPVRVGDGPLRVLQTTAEQMFLDISAAQAARMPRHKGDLELIEHSAGSLTSQAYQKRWNRRNELLADAAERASVAAEWLGARPYPLERLNQAWTLVMAGQFHDIIPGTSTPKAYEYSWNDANLAMNQFAAVLHSASEGIGAGLDTQTKGTPVAVYNPLNIARQDVVEAEIGLPAGTSAVRVTGPDGKDVPSQVSGGKVLFLATAAPLSYAVYDVQPAAAAQPSTLKVTENSLENARYRVKLDQNGDVAGIFDKSVNKELLSGPARLALSADRPHDWPAWNMDWADQQKPPRAYVGGPAKIRVVENGAARVAVEVEREFEGSRFIQTIRLAEGSDRVEFANRIDWKIAASNLKAVFPLAASNPLATYNWDIGTVQRGNNDEKQYEVASHQWFDLTDRSGEFGVTILSDAKTGSDKPDDQTLRLTLIRTPGIGAGNGRDYADQATQDWGHHEFVYGLAGHAGDWRAAETDWQGQLLNQPLIAFTSARHAGALGRSFSLLRVSNSRVRVLAAKKAQAGDEYVVRLVELDGKEAPEVRIAFAGPIAAAREINGAEEPVGPATLRQGELVASFTPYQPRSFAVKLGAPPAKLPAPAWRALTLAYDRSIATRDGRPGDGGFDAQGRAYTAELLPRSVDFAGVRFELAPATPAGANAVTPRGQTIALPPGPFNRVYILAAAADGDQKATFRLGQQPVELTIQDWGGYIGQWDSRLWRQVEVPLPPEPPAGDNSPAAQRARRVREFAQRHGPGARPEYAGLAPAYVKPAPVAWFADHRHGSDGANEPYAYSYLFAYALEVPPGARTLTLPDNPRIAILAISVAGLAGALQPAVPLHDSFDHSRVAADFYGLQAAAQP